MRFLSKYYIVLPLLATLAYAPLAEAGLFSKKKAKSSSEIVKHPDQLVYPELSYTPPVAEDYRTELSNGVSCYMMEYKRVPLISFAINFVADSKQVPDGKLGLHGAAMSLMTTAGSVNYTATEIEENIAYLGASLNSDSDGYGGYASMQMMTKDLDFCLDMFFDLLRNPSFQQDRIDLWKEKRLAKMRERNDHPRTIEAIESRRLMYEDYKLRISTSATINSISLDDLKDWHQKWVNPDNFVITISGDFDKTEMTAELEKRLKNWPKSDSKISNRDPVYANVEPGVYLVDKDVSQARVRAYLPGLDRDDPDWTAAYIMNEVLGSGGMSNRLMNKIRTQEGLAYSAGSYLEERNFGQGIFIGMFQTKVESTAYAMSLLIEEYKKILQDGITEEELMNIKNQLIQAFPTSFNSANNIVSILADEEMSGRYAADPEYYLNLRNKISEISLTDINNAAARLIKPENMVWFIVGQAEGVLAGDDEHQIMVSDFGPIISIPLRDPLTQEVLQ
jgi:zinc protease